MSLGMLHGAGVHVSFCKEVKAEISVLFSRRAFDMTLEQSLGTFLERIGKPEQAIHEQPHGSPGTRVESIF